ncbi:hypothetical protein AYI69_g2194 [Smittium culicis]|uniref:Uncharacterized protein n=1 Tax=Smittium culicis TaxID=133412 RepID=A0A1R1YN79_9FUNG|nr:hypothetical protein AYI69_g2194 [Smittium culicis]
MPFMTPNQTPALLHERPSKEHFSANLDSISAPILRIRNATDPNPSSGLRPRSPRNFRNQNMQPHTLDDSTMSPTQFM